MDIEDETTEEAQLRNLLEKTDQLEKKTGFLISKEGPTILQETDEVLSGIKTNQNAMPIMLGMQILDKNQNIASNLLKRQRGTKTEAFIQALRTRIITNAEGWDFYLETARKTSKLATCNVWPGPLLAEEVVAPKKRQSRSMAQSQLKEPELCEKTEQSDDERAKKFYKKLCKLFTKENQLIPLFKIIINPNNHWETINNGFQMAFLFREGKIDVVDIKEDPNPQVRLLTPVEGAARKGRKSESRVFQINEKVYDLIKYYDIKKPLL